MKEPKMDFKELKVRMDTAHNYKQRWLALNIQLYQVVIPNRDALNVEFNFIDVGKPETLQVWDDTAVLAAYQRANDLHGLLMPQDKTWGKITVNPTKYSPEQIEAVQPILDDVSTNLFWYINQSNLARVVSSSNLDLIGGTAAIWVESKSDKCPLYFTSVPSLTLCIEQSADDVIGTAWFKKKMPGRAVLQYFPNYKGSLLNALKDDPDEDYLVWYGQIERGEDDYFIYCVLDADPFTPLWSRESDYRQLIVYRDKVRPGEADGRGIGLDLLPTIIDLNKMVRDHRKSVAFKANPPIFYTAGSMFNPYSVRQWSGAMIARAQSGQNPLEAFEMPETPEVFQHIEMLQNVIKDGFQVDPLGDVSESPVRTAEEISIREDRAQRTSTTDISRLINELPKQVFEISAKILVERGLLFADFNKAKPIASVSMAHKGKQPFQIGQEIVFEYVSPLYDLQNQQDLNNLATAEQMIQQFFGEELSVSINNFDAIITFIRNKLNLPANLFKNGQQLNPQLKSMIKFAQQNPNLPQPTTAAITPSNIPNPVAA